jgi:hypothetical protein
MAGAEAFADEQFFGVYADGHGRYRATVGGHYIALYTTPNDIKNRFYGFKRKQARR